MTHYVGIRKKPTYIILNFKGCFTEDFSVRQMQVIRSFMVRSTKFSSYPKWPYINDQRIKRKTPLLLHVYLFVGFFGSGQMGRKSRFLLKQT